MIHNRYRSAQPSGENTVVREEDSLLRAGGCSVERLEVESDDIAGRSYVGRAALPGQVVWSRQGRRLVVEAIGRYAPDIVHFHNTFPLLSPAAIRAAHATGTPVVLTLHNFRPLCAGGSFLRDGRVCERCLGASAPYAALRHGCYRDSKIASAPLVAMSAVHRRLGTWTSCVDRLIVPSAFARDKYLAAGWPSDLFEVKPNTARVVGAVRSGPGTGFVAVARLSVEKGVDLLIDAWRLAFPEGDEQLTIVGSGELEAELRARAGGVSGITFTGALPYPETRELLSRARALVVPSRCFEVFPRAIPEAFGSGVPVVAFRLGALAQLVEDGVTGLLAEAGSPQSLAKALKRLSDDPELAEDLGRSARTRYDQTLAPDVTTRQLIEVYRAVIAGRTEEAAASAC